MIILRVLVRLYMIFMVCPVVEPKRWAVGLMVGCFGVDSGFSPSVIWGTTRRYKPVEGV